MGGCAIFFNLAAFNLIESIMPENTEEFLMPVSRRRGAIINLVFNNYGMVVLSIISGIVLVPLYLKHISVALYGAWFAATNIISYLAIVDAGLNLVVSQRMAQAFGGRDFERMGNLLGTGIVLALCQASLIWMVGFSVSPYICQWVHLDPTYGTTLSSAFKISVVAAGLSIIAYTFCGAIQILQRFTLSGAINLTGGALNIVVTILLIKHGYGLNSIAIGSLIQVGVLFLGTVWYMLFLWRSVLKIRIWPSKKIFKEIAETTSYTFLGKIFGMVAGNSDALVTANVMGPQNSAILTLTMRAASLVETVIHRISVSTMLGLAHLSGDARIARVREVILLLFRIIALTSFVGIGGYITFNRDFIGLWVGKGLYGGDILTFLVGVSIVIGLMSQAFGIFLTAIGEIRLPALISLFSGIARIFFLVVLVKQYGLIGAPLASIFSVIAFLPIPLILFKRLEISRAELIEVFRVVATRFVVIGICVVIWRNFALPASAWAAFISNVSLFIVFCALSTYLFDNEFRTISNTVGKKASASFFSLTHRLCVGCGR